MGERRRGVESTRALAVLGSRAMHAPLVLASRRLLSTHTSCFLTHTHMATHTHTLGGTPVGASLPPNMRGGSVDKWVFQENAPKMTERLIRERLVDSISWYKHRSVHRSAE